MRAFNSSIRIKEGNCSHPGCSHYGPLTKGKCSRHYWQDNKMKSVARLEEKELQQNESLSTVIDDLDIIFSQYVRLKTSDENGYCVCRGCFQVFYWTEMECCHYIPRSHSNTRFLEENCVCGCHNCNKNEGGKLSSYSAHFGNIIEKDRLGGVELLEEQARTTYNYSISELKSLMSYYSKEVSQMKKSKPLKI